MWHAAIVYGPTTTECAALALSDVFSAIYDRVSMLCARCRRRPATENESNNARSSESQASQRRQTKENQKEGGSAGDSVVGRALVVLGQQLLAANLGACPPPVPLWR
ncbi:protein O24 [Mandrillus leucophaeus cytomegalovirus]|uniref:Protein O24 n=1 Tax=Mandrillus leucophaeus cytomegalovirus TaxID=1654930 RepID=A0A0G2UGH6_9BETA|nr:protein O24 [Mandrillus leucophaeus cytomegalovirus]AKI29738.1 protein O24 [Mandrillus leucophaeus cytomegalovirus]